MVDQRVDSAQCWDQWRTKKGWKTCFYFMCVKCHHCLCSITPAFPTTTRPRTFSALLRFFIFQSAALQSFPASNYHYSSTLPKNEAARSTLYFGCLPQFISAASGPESLHSSVQQPSVASLQLLFISPTTLIFMNYATNMKV